MVESDTDGIAKGDHLRIYKDVRRRVLVVTQNGGVPGA